MLKRSGCFEWALSLVGTRPNDRVVRSGGERRICNGCMDNRYFVYVLRDSSGNLYKGMTCDLQRRLSENRGGRTRTTRRMHDVEIIYFEEFQNRTNARKREIYFKTAAGRKFLKKVLPGP